MHDKANKTRQKNLAMEWIEDEKAYDIVAQSWIINCLKMYKISSEVIKFIGNTMENWRVELTARGKKLQSEIKKKELETLIQAVKIYSVMIIVKGRKRHRKKK